MPRLLDVQGLTAGYGAIEVLHDLDVHVDEGEIVTIIGANGAGKTTTLHCLSGLVAARHGKIIFGGKEIQNHPPHEIVTLGLSQSPEGRRIFPRLTVLENLQMGAFTRNDKPQIAKDIEHCYDLFPILKERKQQLGGTLSGGEQQMLAVARAILSKPKLLLLDEPSLGLAPLIVVKIFEVIRKLNKEGMSVVLVEQNARMALKLAHRGYVLETGRITATGTGQSLLDDPKVQEAYLGH